jgi:hypothetical protein
MLTRAFISIRATTLGTKSGAERIGATMPLLDVRPRMPAMRVASFI